jgi:hypothetical protein
MRPRHRDAQRRGQVDHERLPDAVDVHGYRQLVFLLGVVPQQVFRGADSELLLSEQFVLRDETAVKRGRETMRGREMFRNGPRGLGQHGRYLGCGWACSGSGGSQIKTEPGTGHGSTKSPGWACPNRVESADRGREGLCVPEQTLGSSLCGASWK